MTESNETNNFASKAIAIIKPDLILQNAVAPSTTNNCSKQG
ncbi:hypothetical protein [Nostoc sp.]